MVKNLSENMTCLTNVLYNI